jgi:hypothetical protein
MKFDSRDNLQISGIRRSNGGRLYFRGYAKSEINRTIMDRTYIISSSEDGYTLLREIDEEITAIEILPDQSFIAIGSFGNLYQYKTGKWTDLAYEISPAEMLSRTLVDDNSVYVVGTGQRFMKLAANGWVPVCPGAQEDGETDLTGLCPSGEGRFIVCGVDGFIAEVSEKEFMAIELPTNVDLNNVAQTSEGQIAVCGNNGTFFIGRKNIWEDYSCPELGVSFTSVVSWRGDIYVSANNSVLLFKNGMFEIAGKIQSFNLIALEDSLWSVGLNQLHRFDGQNWSEVHISL